MSNVKTREELATEFANLVQKQIGRKPRKVSTIEFAVLVRQCAKFGYTFTYLENAIGVLWSVNKEKLESLGLSAKKMYAKSTAQRNALQKDNEKTGDKGISEEEALRIFPKVKESANSTGKRGRRRMSNASFIAAVNSAEETLYAESEDDSEELESAE